VRWRLHRGNNQHHHTERQNQIDALHNHNIIMLSRHVADCFCSDCFVSEGITRGSGG
jgi:hypothetical protein